MNLRAVADNNYRLHRKSDCKCASTAQHPSEPEFLLLRSGSTVPQVCFACHLSCVTRAA